MAARGVDVVTPASLSRYLDTPAITPEILGAMQQDIRPVVLDVGGDEQGARALGQYSSVLRERGYAMFLVVNPYRPFTADTAGIGEAIGQIERSSRLLVTGLVSNPNLMSGTTVETFLAGQAAVELAGRQLGMPVALTAIERRLYDEVRPRLAPDMPTLVLERFFAMPYDE
jgi:hypothetical protein